MLKSMKSYKGSAFPFFLELFRFLLLFAAVLCLLFFGSFAARIFYLSIGITLVIAAALILFISKTNRLTFDFDNNLLLHLNNRFNFEKIKTVYLYHSGKYYDIYLAQKFGKLRLLTKLPDFHLEELKKDFLQANSEIAFIERRPKFAKITLICFFIFFLIFNLISRINYSKTPFANSSEFVSHVYSDSTSLNRENYGFKFNLDLSFDTSAQQDDYFFYFNDEENSRIVVRQGLASSIRNNKDMKSAVFLLQIDKPFSFYRKIYTEKYGLIPKMLKNLFLSNIEVESFRTFSNDNIKALIINGKREGESFAAVHMFDYNSSRDAEFTVFAEKFNMDEILSQILNTAKPI
ncbi:MAG: hypothetical protein PHR06_05970 [Candidatus Cloacimonetes bacterium]|nr:hypothetical protein [Candidatus Cloacimonadota bacterium]